MNGDLSNLSGDELKSTVEGILANPAFGKLVENLQGDGADADSSAIAPPQISPDMMAKLPQIMAAISPLLSASKDTGGKLNTADGEKKPVSADQQKKLLAALRPYLNDHRQSAVDQILRITEMTDLLGSIAPKKPDP